MVSYGGLDNNPTQMVGQQLSSLIWGNTPAPVTQDFLNKGVAASQFIGEDAYGINDPAGSSHTGLDIGVPAGTKLYSPVAGTVICAGSNTGSCGDYYTCDNSSVGCNGPGAGELEIQFGPNEDLILGHVSQSLVSVGQTVQPGTEVALSGGAGSGDHVHVEERVPASLLGITTTSGQAIIDPLNIINGQVSGQIVGVQGQAANAAANPQDALASVVVSQGPSALKAIGLYGVAGLIVIVGVLVMVKR